MGEYDDIINLPHWEPKQHKRMSELARAAQFAPFAALTGYDAAILEAVRLTDSRIENDSVEISILNSKLHWLKEHTDTQPELNVTFFQTDRYKDGGAYVQYTGRLRRFDESEQILIFTDGTKIPLGDITNLSSPNIPHTF